MKTEFETELSQALVARAAGLPPGAAARLRAADYHPREHRLRAPTLGVGVLAGAATAGTVLAVVLGGSAPAYAGWSAAPTSDTPSSSADANCQNQLASMPGAPGGSAPGTGAWQNVLTDVRGPFTVELFQNGGSYAACFTGSSFTSVNQISSSGASGASSNSLHVSSGSAAGGGGPLSPTTSGSGISTTSSGSLQQVVQSHLTTASDGPYTLIDGRTEPGVTAVTLVLDNGQDVVATVADGWFVAWWPGSGSVTSAQVTAAAGTTTQSLLPVPLPRGAGTNSSGPSSNSANSGSSGSAGTTSGNSGDSGSGSGPTTSSNP
jgi:hypothetical protein